MKPFAKKRRYFPDPHCLKNEDIIGISHEISVELLIEAYSFGIFPWPQENSPMLWFCPAQRGILQFSDLHVAKSLQKLQRKCPFKITINTAFADVIRQCRERTRPDQTETWITEGLMAAYIDFHHAGYAISVECWQESQLVGGIYGVAIGNIFCAESMFYVVPNASKMALLVLIDQLKTQELQWMDIQMVTPLTAAFGGKYISRSEYLNRLDHARSQFFT